MIHRKLISVVAVFGLIFTLATCAVGLDPAKDRSTSVSFTLSQLSGPSESSDARALIQGSGYLFIRTVGGPTGDKGPLYGPFPVSSGGTFETTDIPAGSYSHLVVLVCAAADASLVSQLSLPDADILTLITTPAPLETIVAGTGSWKVLNNVEIIPGIRNTLSMTLVPLVSSGSIVDLSGVSSVNLTNTSGAMTRRFLRLDNPGAVVTAGYSLKTLIFNVFATGSTNMGIVALYNSDGVRLGKVDPVGLLSVDTAYEFNYSSASPCYLYLEYSTTGTSFGISHTEDLIPLSTTKDITAFSFITPAVTGVITGQDIAVTVPFGTNVTGLTANFTTTGSIVRIAGVTQTSGVSVNDFSTTVTYTVTAADSSTKNYYVLVTVLPDLSNANLSSLTTSGVAFTPTFIGSTLAYSGSVTNPTTTMTVTPTASDPLATIKVKINTGALVTVASGMPSGTLALDDPTGVNVIVIQVTAQDTTVKTYNLTITKTVLVDITTVGGGSVSPPGSMERLPGSVVPLVATPAAGYRFVSWTGGGASVAAPTSASTTLTVPVSGTNINLLANFTPDFAGGDGSVGAPFEISTLAHLKNVNNFLATPYYFKVMAPIDLATETNWTPLGNSTTPFKGNFDGNNVAISNMTITSVASELGFFGVTNNATIQRVQLVNINITAAWDFVGGLVGNTTGTTTVNNCMVSGTIAAHQGIGGLIGNNDSGQTLNIYRCFANVDISTSYASVGALGGLVGCTYDGSITESYSTGDIGPHGAGVPNGVGGLIGSNMNSSVADSYATGNVYGVNLVGGLIGNNASSFGIERCYSVGLVSATGTNPGGLTASGTVTDCYYDMDTAGLSVGVGNATNTGDMMMSATFAGWDFITVPVWKISVGYPQLFWQP